MTKGFASTGDMTEKKLRFVMMLIIAVGLTLIAIGISLIVFTNIVTNKGTDGILIVAGLIAGGLFVSVPAKIYLTLQLMKYNDDQLREKNRISNEN